MLPTVAASMAESMTEWRKWREPGTQTSDQCCQALFSSVNYGVIYNY
jgi:hypothetical protein